MTNPAQTPEAASSTLPPTAKPGKGWLGFAARIAVSLGVLAALFTQVDGPATLRALTSSRLDALALGLGLVVVMRFYAAYRWFVLLRCNLPEIRFADVLRITMVSGFVGLALPGAVGIELVRVAGLAKLTASLGTALSSVLVDRVFGLLTLALLVVVGLFVVPLEMPPLVTILAWLLLVGLGGLGLALFHPWPREVLRQVPAAGLPGRLAGKALQACSALDEYRSQPKVLIGAMALALGSQFLRVFIGFACALAVGVDVTFLHLLLLIPVTSLIEMLPLSYAGLGLREAGFVAFLAMVGVSEAEALAMSLLMFATILAAGIVGIPYLVRNPDPER